ncbi:hypothetical protein J2W34_005367 [Variovorax boronicumulans]|uniref:hypothetical protein n=1 Tax=Variovorax boronicumulans TaxID=436515 RepID=UPI00278A981B|nr:hypothetical protein [Variovorax boronicumulans]MDQ0073558.1 hypothetical protein [Variovorax boronicumulans]
MAHSPSSPESSETPSAGLLALRACDDIDSLHVVQRAYACLEKLIGPQHTSDMEEVCPSRTELSALMALVNEELLRRIGAADITMQSLRVALSEGDAR